MGECSGFCVCACSVLLIISVGLYGGSFVVLGPLKAGLLKNSVTGKVESAEGAKIYKPGRYFLGLGRQFVEYPTNLQKVEFKDGSDTPSIRANSAGGQQVVVELSFLYRLKVSQLPAIFRKQETNYNARFVNIAQAEISNTIAKFKTEDFWVRRSDMSSLLLAALNSKLELEFAAAEHLQLRKVTVPASLNSIIITQLVLEQNVAKAAFERDANIIRNNILVVREDAAQRVNVINAEAQATAKKLVDRAAAEATLIRLNASATAYSSAKNVLKLNNTGLLRWMWLETVRSLGNSTSMAVGLDSAFVSL